MTSRIAVLASGGGSNLAAILEHLDGAASPSVASVVLVLSDRSAAHALERAEARGIDTGVIVDPSDGAALCKLLESHTVDLIVLAGYLKLVPEAVIERWRGRVLNVHPALLPAFGGPGMYGLRVHRAVIESGARISGPTVHFVDERYDHGQIIAQWPVPVFASDTPESLAARVLRAEHLLFPRVVEAVAAGSIAIGPDGKVLTQQPDPANQEHASFTLTGTSGDALARNIEECLAPRTRHTATP